MKPLEANKRGVFAFMVLVVVTALSHTPPIFACSCPENPDPRTALGQSGAVFAGSVLNIDEDGDRSLTTGTGMRKVDFKVDRAWKGIERIRISVHTKKDAAACGYAFSIGNAYLVYASGEKGHLQVSLCSRTQALADVGSAELAALGTPTFLPEDEDWPPLILISDQPVASGFALAALAGLAILVFRTFKAGQ